MIACSACAWVSLLAAQGTTYGADRPWTAEDSVAVRYFIRNHASAAEWSPLAGNPIVVAPDGTHFFFVTRHGDLTCDCNVYTLSVFSVDAVSRAIARRSSESVRPPKAKRTLTLASDSNYPAIGQAQWHEDSKSIWFVGVQGSGPRQFYSFDIESGEVEQRTNASENAWYFMRRGDTILYGVADPQHSSFFDAYPVVTVKGYELGPFLMPRLNMLRTVFASYRGAAEFPIFSWHSTPDSVFDGPWVSPNGRYVIMLGWRTSERAPPHWANYEYRSDSTPKTGERKYSRFYIADLQARETRPLLDAPAGTALPAGCRMNLAPAALWSADSERVVLVNTALPLSPREPAHRHMAYVVQYNVRTDKLTVIEPLLTTRQTEQGTQLFWVSAVQWRTRGREISIKRTNDAGAVLEESTYDIAAGGAGGRPSGEVRIASDGSTVLRGGLRLILEESANTPPAVVASNSRGSIRITAPDPALEGVRRAEVRTVTWTERNGATAWGGLMLPSTGSITRPPPLVIQAYRFQADRFRPDGSHPTAYAAQPLASAGIAVLQIHIPDDNEGAGTPREGPAFVERIDSAVESLAGQGIVDQRRVGLIGFSRGGYLTYYAITHPGRTKISAAIEADGWTGSFAFYLKQLLLSPDLASMARRSFERQYGGTFWENKAEWLQQEAVFNVDRVQTPLLFALNMNGKVNNALAVFDVLAAFRVNNKPFELVIFPHGAHQLVRPRERFASIQATVDWMRFWLQGYEDPDPAKSEQFKRWRKMEQAIVPVTITREIGARVQSE